MAFVKCFCYYTRALCISKNCYIGLMISDSIDCQCIHAVFLYITLRNPYNGILISLCASYLHTIRKCRERGFGTILSRISDMRYVPFYLV